MLLLQPLDPITGTAAGVSNCDDLNVVKTLAEDGKEWEPVEKDAAGAYR
jgi:hypothetical protein